MIGEILSYLLPFNVLWLAGFWGGVAVERLLVSSNID